MDMPVFVINLKHSVERRNRTTKQLNDLGVTFQIIEAVDGRELSGRDIFSSHDFGLVREGLRSRHLLKGEIGCLLSHLKIYKKMIDEHIELACILEDDIEEYKTGFRELLRSEDLKIAAWDLFLLGHHGMHSRKEAWCKNKKSLHLADYCIGEPVETPVGSYGYAIRKQAAQAILDHAYPLRMPFDWYIGNAAALGIRTCILSPPCVSHNYSCASTIYHNAEIIYKYPFLESLRRPVRKIYRWLPFLQAFRVWINIIQLLPFAFFRKTGMLKKSYAKFK